MRHSSLKSNNHTDKRDLEHKPGTGNIPESNQECLSLEFRSQYDLRHTYFSVIGAVRKTDSMSWIWEFKFLMMSFCWSQNLRNSALSLFRASTTPAQWHSRRFSWSNSSADKERNFTVWSVFPVYYGVPQPLLSEAAVK